MFIESIYTNIKYQVVLIESMNTKGLLLDDSKKEKASAIDCKDDLLEAFLVDCKIRNFSPESIAGYKSHLKYFLSFFPVEPNVNNLKDFLVLIRDEKMLSASTVENYFTSISCFYEFLVWEKVVDANIIPQFKKRYLRYFKEQRSQERQLISIDQMRLLVDSTPEIMYKAMFLLFAKTGIRRQELIDIDIQDLNLHDGYVTLKPHAKRSNRVVFFDNECKAILEKWVKWRYDHKIKCKPLFIGVQGKRIYREFVNEKVEEIAYELGFHNPNSDLLYERFSPHCFRHFFTSLMRRVGCPKEHVQELRGDARKDAIDVYHHIPLAELQNVYLQYMPEFGIDIR